MYKSITDHRIANVIGCAYKLTLSYNYTFIMPSLKHYGDKAVILNSVSELHVP